MKDQPNQRKIWHEALTTLQTARIRKVHTAIGPSVLGLFEYFEAGFLQELHIDEAIVRYEKIAQEFADWKKEHLTSDISIQKKIFDRMVQRRSCQGGDS
jgi:hypothetical protein